MKNILAVIWSGSDAAANENIKKSMEGLTSGVRLSTNHTNLYELKGEEVFDGKSNEDNKIKNIPKFFEKLKEDEIDTVVCIGNETAIAITKQLDEYAKGNSINAYFIAIKEKLPGETYAEEIYFKLGRNAVSLAEMFRTGIVLTYSPDGVYGAQRI